VSFPFRVVFYKKQRDYVDGSKHLSYLTYRW